MTCGKEPGEAREQALPDKTFPEKTAGTGRRIGIMGGTFDPIHIGHLMLGECAWNDFKLDTVIFMPSGNPPHKLHREGRASNEDRLAMTALAVADNPHFECSDREMKREGLTYTYMTLGEMKRENPSDELFFIIGADSLFDFDSWRNPPEICRLCTLLVAVRNHTPMTLLDKRIAAVSSKYPAKIRKLTSGNIDISSSRLRNAVKSGRSVRYYVPEPVREYIEEHRLYLD